jgi:hypothetical protein
VLDILIDHLFRFKRVAPKATEISSLSEKELDVLIGQYQHKLHEAAVSSATYYGSFIESGTLLNILA